MRRPGIAINAAMLATTIRVQTCFKANIGTLVASDDRFGGITKILCTPAWSFGVRPRNQLNVSVVDLLQTLLNLLSPSLLSILVHFDVKTIQEGISQSRPRLGGELQRFV